MKKLIIILFSTLLFFSCVSSDIRNSNAALNKNNYTTALAYLEKHLYKPSEKLDPDVLENYQISWNRGREYYSSTIQQNLANNPRDMLNYKKDYYELYKSYFSLPQATKDKLPLIVVNQNDLEHSRKLLVTSYFEYANQLPSLTYQNRLHKYLILKKANEYALPTETYISQKLQKVDTDLEKNLKILILNASDFYFKNSIQAKLENSLLERKLFSISNSENYNLLFQVKIDNYHFLQNQASFSTVTEYKVLQEAYDKIENGKAIKAYREIRVPYQKLIYGKKNRLSYLCTYTLYDKYHNIVLQRSVPCQEEDEKKWNQYLRLDFTHFIDIPENETEPNSLSQEELIQESFIPVLKYLKQDIENLKKF